MLKMQKLASSVLAAALLVAALPVDASHRDDDEPAEPQPCQCSARLKFSKPQLSYVDNTLTFTPRFDITIKSKLPRRAPVINDSWSANLQYVGLTAYESEDVAVPGGVVFSGAQEIASGPCGTKHKLKGVALDPATLSGVTRDLLGEDEKMQGLIAMKAKLEGCDFSIEDQRQSKLKMKEFGNFRAGGWRRVRS